MQSCCIWYHDDHLSCFGSANRYLHYPNQHDMMKQKSPIIFGILMILSLGALVSPTFAEHETPVPHGSIRVSHKLAKSKLPDLAKIDLCTAVQSALSSEPGKAIQAELEVEDGTLVYSILILNHNHEIVEYEVDAGTGKILVSEREEGEDEDGDEDEDADLD